MELAETADLESAFGTIVQPKARKNAKVFQKKKKKKITEKDNENYIGYTSKDHHSEAG